VLKDNPQLTTRMGEKPRHPLKCVVDPELLTPPDARLFLEVQRGVVLYCTGDAPVQREDRLRSAGAEVVRLPRHEGRLCIGDMLKDLDARGVVGLLVEGGSGVIGSCFREKLVDRLDLALTPMLFGGTQIPLIGSQGVPSVRDAIRLRDVSVRPLDPDILYQGYPVWEDDLG
jgi:diaminohydroxyphosphoribosylaminopyrimidine deaminase / 5-amino-6-(5-phosphoribosylamino)uracil reductase